VPEGLSDEQVVFLSDAATTGYMGADFCDIKPGDTVAVWGCGGVGLMAQKSAYLLGAGRVIGIDRFPERLNAARDKIGSETINYEDVESVLEILQDMTGGRGPDACIDAVGMEAHGTGMQYMYDRVKQGLRLHTDRGDALREAIMACRKGGTLSILGVYGVMDKFPVGVMMNKALTIRTAQQHGQKYVPRLLEHTQRGELDAAFLATHRVSLEEAPRGYEMFKNKEDGCLRVVFTPQVV
jgi:threonine dehydrogenase-like Zn-dependent dehydrogenase